MIKVFDHSVFGHEVSQQLATLHQGRQTTADYAIEFHTLAATCEWNKPALKARFLEGLSREIKGGLVSRPGSTGERDNILPVSQDSYLTHCPSALWLCHPLLCGSQ
ncbi:Retrotransposon-derived PEG10 [Labeo rohita]|uniref:Retrotransposon-derived PEG10 n=1 Tax=Labeo rohita TaxID=84645 RepID=A0A498NUN3_LABRO|nr:Retrotransposon-derived PEG10 [Labeo rohita]RXN37370.1 Retrotransposon-derived PEG10 [Labeo rohita]